MALNERQNKRKIWLEATITGIEARLTGDITGGAVSMTLNGRSIQRYGLDELNTLYKRYANELTQLEKMEIGQAQHSAVRVRF